MPAEGIKYLPKKEVLSEVVVSLDPNSLPIFIKVLVFVEVVENEFLDVVSSSLLGDINKLAGTPHIDSLCSVAGLDADMPAGAFSGVALTD